MENNETNQANTLSGGYCPSLFTYQRLQTRLVSIGDLPLGGRNPIRVQSMCTTNTLDTKATVAQSIRLINLGCEYLRLTAPSLKEAENLGVIKKEIRKQGYKTPLIADIHFTPNAAECAARLVEKVRINPGNYIDKKKFAQIDYTDLAYEAAIESIRKRFSPLVKICKEYGTAMRIGTNHGSLSDRIMSKYGDTPLGMVESAMEFIRICQELNYHELVISMKASNPLVMVQAYRLLVKTMVKEGMPYPLHLGVTEAGDGIDGRVKSAVGIGALLADGLGDTIRVSLTEDPEAEIPVAQALIKQHEKPELASLKNKSAEITYPINPFKYQKRETQKTGIVGGDNVPRVIINLSEGNLKDPFVLNQIGYRYDALLDKYHLTDAAADFIYLANSLPSFTLPGNLGLIYNYATWLSLKKSQNIYPLLTASEYLAATDLENSSQVYFVSAPAENLSEALIKKISGSKQVVLILEHTDNMQAQRHFFAQLLHLKIKVPVIIQRKYAEKVADFRLQAASDSGALLVDGLGNGLWLANNSSQAEICATAFTILQATRSRISKTDYISCPSCGRTLFDLQQTTQLIRAQTAHLKGLKIAIMGCIVNGPGEMADADYGYVGTGTDKISLYRGKDVVHKNVHTNSAVDQLISLIKADGKWTEAGQVFA